MATSGTVSTTTFRTVQVIDTAIRRCKLRPEQIGGEQIDIAKNALYLLLSALGNRGDLLWCVEKVIVPLYQGQAEYNLPLGTVDTRNNNLRYMSRLTGTYTSSAGGDINFAFDDDFETECAQTSIDGNISVAFSSATQVTTVGILPGADGAYDLVCERSVDNGLTWTPVYATGEIMLEDRVWLWFDIDGNLAGTNFRVRETGGGTINFRELFLGNNPQEIPLGRLNQDDYTALPNKTFAGRPLQFWLNRQRVYPVMNTWPVCDFGNRYDQFTVWRNRYIQDVGTLNEELDIPQRWFDAICWALAEKLSDEYPEVDGVLAGKITSKAASTWFEAQQEERDNSPTMLQPNIAVYNR